METALVGVVGALAGVALGSMGAFYTAKAQFDRQAASDRAKLMRDKLELLYQTLDDISHAFNLLVVAAMETTKTGKVSPPGPKIAIGQAKMLVGFYVPELRDSMLEMEDQWKLFSAELIRVYPGAPEGQNEVATGRMVVLMQGIGSTCDQMQDSLAVFSKQYLNTQLPQPRWNDRA